MPLCRCRPTGPTPQRCRLSFHRLELLLRATNDNKMISAPPGTPDSSRTVHRADRMCILHSHSATDPLSICVQSGYLLFLTRDYARLLISLRAGVATIRCRCIGHCFRTIGSQILIPMRHGIEDRRTKVRNLGYVCERIACYRG